MNKKISIVLIIFVVSSALAPVTQQEDDVIGSLIHKLEIAVPLTADQSARIKSVLSAAEAQMARDREMFPNNEPARIEAAKKRRDMTEVHIEAVLTAEQQKKYPEVYELIHLDDSLITLMETVEMTYSQAYGAVGIALMEQKQAELDRETYKESASALISSARARKEMADIHVQDLLSPEQQEKYSVFKQERDADPELFELKEGLILDPEQTAAVKQILEAFRAQFQGERKKPGEWGERSEGEDERGMDDSGRGGQRGGGMGGGRGGGMGGDRGGGMSSGMGGPGRGGPGGPGGGMMPGRGGPGGEMMQKMKEQETKKENAIKKLLTPDQTERYEQILKTKTQEREKRIKQMREGMIEM